MSRDAKGRVFENFEEGWVMGYVGLWKVGKLRELCVGLSEGMWIEGRIVSY